VPSSNAPHSDRPVRSLLLVRIVSSPGLCRRMVGITGAALWLRPVSRHIVIVFFPAFSGVFEPGFIGAVGDIGGPERRPGPHDRYRVARRAGRRAVRSAMRDAAAAPPIGAIAIGDRRFALFEALADNGVVGLFEEIIFLEAGVHFVAPA